MYASTQCGCDGDYPDGLGGYSRAVAVDRRRRPGAPPPPPAIVAPARSTRAPVLRRPFGTYIDYPQYGRQPGLGFIPWATVIGAGVDLARSFIGGSDATSCPGQYSGAQLGNLLVSLTPAEMNAMYTAFNKVNPGSVQPYFKGVDLDWMAFAIAGGGDCQVTTTNGKAMVALVQQMFNAHPEALAASASFPTTTGPQPIDGGPVIYNPVPGPVLLPGGSEPWVPTWGDPDPVAMPGPVLNTDGSGSLPADSSWLDKIKDVIGDAASAAARAAATAGASSAYANLPAEQQRDIANEIRYQQGGTMMGGTMLGLPTPVLLGGAALLAVLLLRPAAPARR